MAPNTFLLGSWVIILLSLSPSALCQVWSPLGQVPLFKDIRFPFFPPWFFFCGSEGQECCTPSFATIPEYGPLVKCDTGLGCDLTTSTCVSPCGAPGEPCCDGPETRALKWNNYGVYSPTGFQMKEMCNDGFCDKPSHKCFDCTSTPGSACCPPDASQATARCNGENLECKFDDSLAARGTCFLCGGAGNPPCHGECEQDLKLINGICVNCGDADQIACDENRHECNHGCKDNLRLVDGICKACGDQGQIPCGVPAYPRCPKLTNQFGCKTGMGIRQGLCQMCGTESKSPCDGFGCFPPLARKNGLCTVYCGHENQEPCDDRGCFPPLQVLAGNCKTCGSQKSPACPKGGCHPELGLLNGVCDLCGSDGRLPCDAGCNPPLLPQGGFCSKTCGQEEYPQCDNGCRDGRTLNSLGLCISSRCANEGEDCIFGFWGTAGTGLLCCKTGVPLSCTTQKKCARCVPHGAPVLNFGTQICCTPGDEIVADDDGRPICGIAAGKSD
ncbi:hypothetical protein BGZ57DRAFT_919963 [Hyaloscypha finlandica]|nr:hypothetical protein BGZ57DRAFT_919963 [Hyaloscypha finlandica]